MKRNFFVLLVLFTIVSLLGIISIQGYWITIALKNKEQEFSMAVGQSLISVAKEIEEREFKEYLETFQNLIDSVGAPKTSQFNEVFMFLGNDEITNLSSLHTFGILEEEYNIQRNSSSSKIKNDSIIKDYKGVKTTTILKDVFDKENRLSYSVERLKNIDRINAIDRAKYKTIFLEIANTFPVHKRIDAFELNFLLKRELNDRKIFTPIEFIIHSEGIPTNVKSNNYTEGLKGTIYRTPIFLNDNGESDLELLVSFPKKDKFVQSSVIGFAALSFLLTIIVIIVSSSALFQFIQQKKLSEIKTEFINNMSHEFKTPIATINLAIDSIVNPKNIINKDKIKRYVSVVKEENKRMQSQIENILKISQLDRGKEFDENKKENVHNIIEKAINHFSLIISSKNGVIKTSFTADNFYCYINELNFINVFVNILDNAIKYSLSSPEIKITTYNKNNNIIIEIGDKGIGMDSKTQNLIFKKFFREQKGDIHNVKGQGLGLAYVKKIISISNGKVFVNSNLGEGSTFFIELPFV
ncbi:MAG: HAMP domain-containing sensor histidine kinase [Flavobacteriaceae bacterium]|nr:HAMP domain-containing sensor histidine kinase [Flavobacteriaceae bacterium]